MKLGYPGHLDIKYQRYHSMRVIENDYLFYLTSLALVYHPEEYVDIGRIGERNDESNRPSFWIFPDVPYRISYTSRRHANSG